MHERQAKDAVTCLIFTMSVYQCTRDKRKTQLPVLYSRCRYINARETSERRSYLSYIHDVGISMHERQAKDAVTCLIFTMSVYQCTRDKRKTQLPVLYSRCRYTNARETNERRSYLSYSHDVGIPMHERQEKRRRHQSRCRYIALVCMRSDL